MSISGAKKTSLVDPATGTVVQFNHIHTDSEHSNEVATSDMITGVELYADEDNTLTLHVLDRKAKAQLEEWQEDETDLQAVVYGVQHNILYFEEVTMTFDDPKIFQAGDRGRFVITMTSDIADPDVHSGINLLYLVDEDHAADTYDIVFPVEGAELTLSADGGTGDLEIVALDYSGTQLASELVAAGSRAEVSLELPANTYTVRVNLPSGHSEPALRTDGKAKYTAG